MDIGNVAEEIWVRLRADIVEFQKNFAIATTQMKGLVSQAGAMSSQMQKFGKTLGLVSTVTAALGGLAVKTFADFEQSMANTFSVLGAGKDEMEKLTKFAREMGNTTVFSASQSADAMYFLASAGFDTNKIMGALKGTLDLAAATQYDLAETTRIVASNLSAFNLEASDASRISNVFSAIIAKSQATMDKLGESMKYVAPNAAQLGISIEQMSAALGLLFNAGLEGSTAGTNLRQAFIKLQKPTNEAKTALKALGLTLSEVNPQYHDLVEIIGAFEKAGAGAIDKGDELAAIFDTRSVTAMQILINQGADALANLETQITGTNKAAEAAALQVDTLSGAWKLAKSAFEEAAISIGGVLAPAIRGLVEYVTDLVRSFNELPESTKAILVAIPAIAAALGLIISPIALLIGYIPNIIAGWGTLTAILASSAGTLLAVGAGLVAVAAGVAYWIDSQKTATEKLRENIKEMRKNIDSQIEYKNSIKKSADEFINLATKTKLTKDEQQRLKELYEKLRILYPNLIQDTDNYRTALEGVQSISADVALELEKLAKSKEKLRKLELTVNINEAKKKIAELRESVGDTSWFEKIFTDKTFTLSDKFIKKLSNSLGTFETLQKSIVKIGSQNQLQMSELEKAIGSTIKSEQDVEKLTKDIFAITALSNDILNEQNDLYNQGTEEAEDRADAMDTTLDVLNSISDVLIKVGKDVGEIGSLDTQLQMDQIELDRLNKAIEGTVEIKKKVNKVKIVSEEDIQDVQDMKNALLSLQNDVNRSRLSVLTIDKDKSLKNALEYAELEQQINLTSLELEKQDALKSAKETGLQKSKINEAFQEKENNLVKIYERTKLEIRKEFADKALDIEYNRINNAGLASKEELLIFQGQLNEKLKTLDKYSNDYVSILEKIREIQALIDQPEENRLLFNIDAAMNNEQLMTALEQYKTYLDGKLLLEDEFSNNWYDILNERARVERDIYELNLENLKVISDSTLSIITAGFDQAWSQWVVRGRKAKSEMDAIWIALKNSFLQAIRDILVAEITKQLLKLIISIAGIATGGLSSVAGAALGAAGGVVTGAPIGNITPASQSIGNLNPPNIGAITPASLSKALQQEQGQQVIENNFYIQNPIVNDNRYWETVTEQYIEPATTRIKYRN